VHYGERPDPLATQSVVDITPRPYAEQTIRAIFDGQACLQGVEERRGVISP